MTEQQQSLGTILRQRRSVALIEDATIIRDFPEDDERTQYAGMLIREAMVQQSLGNIDPETQYRVYSILAFAMPEPDTVPDHYSCD